MSNPDILPARETHPVSSLVRPMYVMLVALLITGVIGIWYSRDSAASSSSVANSQDISACRGIIKNQLDMAVAAKGEAVGVQDADTHIGLIALLVNDKLTQFYVIMDGPISQRQIDATQLVVDQRQELYTEALHQSLHDPVAFLRECRRA